MDTQGSDSTYITCTCSSQFITFFAGKRVPVNVNSACEKKHLSVPTDCEIDSFKIKHFIYKWLTKLRKFTF